jgi:hypothetical protein
MAVEMSVLDWISIKDNPRQRNTERRAKSARRKHLASYQKIHRIVFAASRKGDVLCKLDGHTRALLWQLGELESPPDGKVEVVLIEVANIEEAKQIYDMMDAQPSVKKPSDNIFGACRELGFRLDSFLLRGCAFNTQLKIATTGKRFTGDSYAMVREWKDELIALDKMALSSQNTILISVMLTAIRMDGTEKPCEFFRSLERNEGVKTSAGYDGIELLSRVMAVRRAEGRTAGYDNLVQICGQAWTAYQMWKDGKRRKNTSLAIADFTRVVTDLNQSRKNTKTN